MSGAYLFPAGITAAANYQNISGTAFARTVAFTTGGTPASTVPSLTANVTPIGAYRLPALNLLDLRIEKAFGLPAGQRFVVRLNVYNSLNANTTLSVQQQSGATFLQPTSILPPRLFRVRRNLFVLAPLSCAAVDKAGSLFAGGRVMSHSARVVSTFTIGVAALTIISGAAL